MLRACLIAQLAYIFSGDFTICKKSTSMTGNIVTRKSLVLFTELCFKKINVIAKPQIFIYIKQAEFWTTSHPCWKMIEIKTDQSKERLQLDCFNFKNNNFW